MNAHLYLIHNLINDLLMEKDQMLSNFILYTAPSGEVKFEVYVRDETVWLTQKQMSKIFDCSVDNIALHLRNIYLEGELEQKATSEDFSVVQMEGARKVKRKIDYYNLDAIISVGYRVNSVQATQFRIWATRILREYIIKGFAMDDERLKNPNTVFGKDYFDEQLARIRNIRSSERRFYQKITDIYAACSADYNADADMTKQFFATVQNKLHFAITGQTAAEIIGGRVSSQKVNLGLSTWKNAPKGEIRKTDVGIAKNYLDEKELDGLNRIVTMYLDFAELQAQKGVVMHMKDWVQRLDAFLKFNEREILLDNGTMTHEVAVALAEKEYETYRVAQDRVLESDFDREVTKLLQLKKEEY